MRKTVSNVLIFALVLFVFAASGPLDRNVHAAMYSDDFEAYATGGVPGGTWVAEGGSWTVASDGTKVASQSGNSGSGSYLSSGYSTWTDYSVQANIKPGSTSYFNGIAGRYTDQNNFYILFLKSGNLYLKKKVGGSWTTLNSVSFSFNTSTWYTLKLELKGTSIKGYVNGIEKISVTDSSLSGGKIALRTESSCKFDDVFIETFDSPTPTPTSTPTTTPAPTPTPTTTPTPVGGRTISCDTTAEIQDALKNAQPGDTIIIKPGTYTGDKNTSGNSGAYFFSGVNGTADSHITVKSESASNPAVLQGTATSSLYVLYITGDYWDIKDLAITNAKKGIMLDHSNYTTVYNCEVYGIGEEAIHIRDGSSYCVIENCKVRDAGLENASYGEGIYVGSDGGKWGTFAKECDYNVIKNCTIGNCKAEPIDVKEGTTGTVIEGCIFDGTGISGSNSADSFMDIKGNNGIIRNNIGYQNGNSTIVNAFEVHQRATGWGLNNDFYGNTVYMDGTSQYIVYTDANATAKAHGNTRSPAGNMYGGNVTEY